jgi:hypothetical protein
MHALFFILPFFNIARSLITIAGIRQQVLMSTVTVPPAGKPLCYSANSLQEAPAVKTSTISKDQVTLSIS